jgi:hypothetical protein
VRRPSASTSMRQSKRSASSALDENCTLVQSGDCDPRAAIELAVESRKRGFQVEGPMALTHPLEAEPVQI